MKLYMLSMVSTEKMERNYAVLCVIICAYIYGEKMDKFKFVKSIPNYASKDNYCCLCGKNKNVKYKIAIHENGETKYLPCCSVCTLFYLQYFNKKE